MDWSIYSALIVGSLAIAAGIAFLVIRALQTWRDFKRFRRQLNRELDRIAEAGERASAASQHAGSSPQLEASLTRLRRSLAQFAVLRAAVDEVSDSVARVTALYPRK